MLPVKALLFDLDNTLVHSDLAYDLALARLGLSVRSADYQKARQTVKERLPSRHVCARNRLLYLKVYAESRGDFSPASVLDSMKAYEEALAAEVGAQWAGLGRDRLFKELAARFQLVLVTNENLRTQLVKLRAIDPDSKFFSHILTSEELGVEKPDDRIFKSALKFLGAQPGECVMVGDSFADDIIPALELGMKCVLTREFQAEEPAQGGYDGKVVGKLEELREMFLT